MDEALLRGGSGPTISYQKSLLFSESKSQSQLDIIQSQSCLIAGCLDHHFRPLTLILNSVAELLWINSFLAFNIVITFFYKKIGKLKNKKRRIANLFLTTWTGKASKSQPSHSILNTVSMLLRSRQLISSIQYIL